MSIIVGRLELPDRLTKDTEVSNQGYAKFIAEPFERGYGHTLGNSLRRVLLSSIEGAAITAVKIDGVVHEFSTIDGIMEDVSEIILNLKSIKFQVQGREQRILTLNVTKSGSIKAADIKEDAVVSVVNKDQVIATAVKDVNLKMTLWINIGRGYRPSELNKTEDLPVDAIPIDSIFSPVQKVKYYIENTRVGRVTDYDRLIIEVWTDNRITPDEALKQASSILQRHLDVFVNYDQTYIVFEEKETEEEPSQADELERLLNMPISEIELSVRSANCIEKAKIENIRDLVTKTESEMLRFRNFGKKSLNEIKGILNKMGLSFGMKLDQLDEGSIGVKTVDLSEETEESAE